MPGMATLAIIGVFVALVITLMIGTQIGDPVYDLEQWCKHNPDTNSTLMQQRCADAAASSDASWGLPWVTWVLVCIVILLVLSLTYQVWSDKRDGRPA